MNTTTNTRNNRNTRARLSTAATIAAIFLVSACGSDQASPPAPAAQINLPDNRPTKHMGQLRPMDEGQDTQPVAKHAHVHVFMHGTGRPDITF